MDNTQTASINIVTSKERLTELVWDAMLEAEQQDEHWRDTDTCRLIVRKIINNGPVKCLPDGADLTSML